LSSGVNELTPEYKAGRRGMSVQKIGGFILKAKGRIKGVDRCWNLLLPRNEENTEVGTENTLGVTIQ